MRQGDLLGLSLALAVSFGGRAAAQVDTPVDSRGGVEIVRAVHLPDGRTVYEAAQAPVPVQSRSVAAPARPQSISTDVALAAKPVDRPQVAAASAPPAGVERQVFGPPSGAVAFVDAAADRPGTGATNFAASELPAPPLAPTQVRVASGAAAVDVFTLKTRPGLVIDPRLGGAYDLDYTYTGPGLVRMNSGRYSLDVRPQWGFGVSSFNGSSTHAGAVVRFGRDLTDDVIDAYSQRSGEARRKDRWFVYAGASGKAFGWNVLPGLDGRRDLSFEETGSFVGTAQAGLAWRAGDLTAALGYAHDKARVKLFGARSETDDRFGLFISYRPEPPRQRPALSTAPPPPR